jgi:hypothetical protein
MYFGLQLPSLTHHLRKTIGRRAETGRIPPEQTGDQPLGAQGLPTERQIAANRVNAKKSTGPKTPAGKLRSTRNAYRHGFSGPVVWDRASSRNMDSIAHDLVGRQGGISQRQVLSLLRQSNRYFGSERSAPDTGKD